MHPCYSILLGEKGGGNLPSLLENYYFSGNEHPIDLRPVSKFNCGRGVYAEVEKGVEHGSIAPRRKWTGPFLSEGFGPSLPHLLRIL